MMWINRCVVLILLYHLQLTLAQVDLGLTGSCIEAGLTECCLFECQGLGGSCFCDEICLTAEDCCRDIYQLDFCVNFAGTECTSGSVRLVGGLRPYEGLVEVCIFQSWHPVCNTSFSYPQALVACNQLGYSATLDSHTSTIQLLDNTTVLNRTAYGPNCSGDESRLTECIVDFRYCVSGDEQATVQCIPIDINECDTANGGCSHYCNNTDGSYFCSCPVGYELSGTLICQAKQCVEVLTSASNGVLQCNSSVQVTHTRCNTSCDIGYEVVGSAVRICQPDGTWSGESAYCQPLRCPTLFPPINGYVQLPCTPLYDSECFVRCFDGFELVNGNDSVRCDIDKNDEEMVKWTEYGVCKKNSLTYLTTTTGTSESLSTYPSATVTPTETSVNCSSPGQIRLVDGSHQFDGRVEICINGEWGTVCNDLWDYNDAKVVCRQLGHPEVYAKAYNNSYFGEDVGQSKLHQVDCVGDESALLDCRHAINSYDCFHYQAAGVECEGNSTRCSYYGELHLVGGDSGNEGRVEICINGEWGTVCDDSWDNDDAKVVCRQLGYSTNGALGQQGAHYGEGTGKIHLDEMGCSGNESDLLLCSHLPVGVHDCEHKEDAGVRCPHTSSHMESAPLPGAQVAGITVGAVVIVISLSTVFAILVMCYKYRKRLREKNIDLRNQDSTSPEKLHVQENIAYCQVVRHHPAPIYRTISEVVQSPNVFGSENDYEIMF